LRQSVCRIEMNDEWYHRRQYTILYFHPNESLFVFLPSFFFIFESPKEEEKSKQETRREEKDRSKSSQNLFLFLSLSPVSSCKKRKILATSILKQSPRKALKIPSIWCEFI
jgi:hypothetical protein